jgi:hypothetical protein
MSEIGGGDDCDPAHIRACVSRARECTPGNGTGRNRIDSSASSEKEPRFPPACSSARISRRIDSYHPRAQRVRSNVPAFWPAQDDADSPGEEPWAQDADAWRTPAAKEPGEPPPSVPRTRKETRSWPQLNASPLYWMWLQRLERERLAEPWPQLAAAPLYWMWLEQLERERSIHS